jgi:transaldolase/glucose-6-phosphate isomerase
MHSAPDMLTRWPALEIAAKRARLQNSLHLSPGAIADALQGSADVAGRAAAGLWRRDPSVWSADVTVQKTIADRLGWMSSPLLMADSIDRLRTFAARVKGDGFTDVVLLGMGGSSLAPEVLRAILGIAAGWPRFHMLDSTDPAAVRAIETTPRRTLYLLASKSGTTIEPNSLAAHFRQRLIDNGVPRWGDHFVAITDPGTELDRRARAEQFRDVFTNPADIGGRYSALSFFGLVPAALMGQDIEALVGWGLAMLAAADPDAGSPPNNPAVALGLAIGAGALASRDKLTLVVPPAFDAFGLWVEQLIAESTGKNGKGVVPIAGEPLGDPASYGADRLFVCVRVGGSSSDDGQGAVVRALKSVAPVVEVDVAEPAALGAEFLRWEIATAIAGAIISIDPFDQPNVQQAKDATQTLLSQYTSSGQLPIATADATTAAGVALTLTRAARSALRQSAEAILASIEPRDYFALLAYLGPDPALEKELRTLRRAVRDRTRAATMFGYGPRYLHSTGQLHKGGPNTGVFLLISATPVEDLPIPGEPFSFGTLELAQAVGDFAALDAAGRRGLHAHLPSPDPAVLHELSEMLLAGISSERK